jgi:hypothetical protein
VQIYIDSTGSCNYGKKKKKFFFFDQSIFSESFLIDHVDATNVGEIFELADFYEGKLLRKFCVEFIKNNWVSVQQSKTLENIQVELRNFAEKSLAPKEAPPPPSVMDLIDSEGIGRVRFEYGKNMTGVSQYEEETEESEEENSEEKSKVFKKKKNMKRPEYVPKNVVRKFRREREKRGKILSDWNQFLSFYTVGFSVDLWKGLENNSRVLYSRSVENSLRKAANFLGLKIAEADWWGVEREDDEEDEEEEDEEEEEIQVVAEGKQEDS